MCFTRYSLFVSSLKAKSCQGNTKEYEIKNNNKKTHIKMETFKEISSGKKITSMVN